MVVIGAVMMIAAVGVPVNNPEEYVNTLQGTWSTQDLSTGNTLPLVGRPWGMNTWSAATKTDTSFWFNPSHQHFYGIRCTHQPSPWMGDYGRFMMFASVGQPTGGGENPYNLFDHTFESTWKPYLLSTRSLKYNSRNSIPLAVSVFGPAMSVTATDRAAIVNVAYGPHELRLPDSFDQRRHFYIRFPLSTDRVYVTGKVVTAYTTKADGCGGNNNMCPTFKMHVYGKLSCTPESVSGNGTSGVTVNFAADGCDELDFKVATSFISLDMAEMALGREVGDKDFDALVAESKEVWNKHLRRLVIEDKGEQTDDAVTIFYSGLYRASMFPRRLFEINADGEKVHYSPFAVPKDGEHPVFPGVVSTDHGFWDAYRTVYPLLTLVYPDKLGELLEGFVNAYREGGWLPKWGSPGYRGTMISTFQDIVFADAIVNNISGFSHDDAYKAIYKDATHMPVSEDPVQRGRNGLKEYLQYKYVPYQGCTHCCCGCVVRTQEYAFADFCISQAAAALNKSDDAALFKERSGWFVNVFNNDTGFPEPRGPDGHFMGNVDLYDWSNSYREGGPWQYRLQSVYNIPKMQELYGGPSGLVQKVEDMLNAPAKVSSFNPYHEMREMELLGFGQYAHNNQPVHHVLYIPQASGAPSVTQRYVRRVLDELYHADSFSGDEDNGEMGAWYVLSSLGIYNLMPSTGNWVFGTPLFRRVSLHLPTGKTVTFSAPNNGKDTPYTTPPTWNGVPIQTPHIAYSQLMEGGVLAFDMSEKPTL